MKQFFKKAILAAGGKIEYWIKRGLRKVTGNAWVQTQWGHPRMDGINHRLGAWRELFARERWARFRLAARHRCCKESAHLTFFHARGL